MKNFVLFSLFASLIACGSNSDNSQVSHSIFKGLKSYTFSVDNRLADGNLETVQVTKNEYGTYDATFRVITSGFGAPSVDTTREIGWSLDCTPTQRRHKLVALKCFADLRPADGQLVELTLIRNDSGTFDATLHTAAYSTLISPELDETVDLSAGMTFTR